MSLLYVTYLPGAFLDGSAIKKTKLVRLSEPVGITFSTDRSELL